MALGDQHASATTAIAGIGDSVAHVNGSVPPSGNANDKQRHRGERADHDERAGDRGAQPALGGKSADRERGRRERGEQRRDGLASAVITPSVTAAPGPAPRQRQRAGDRRQQAERERAGGR